MPSTSHKPPKTSRTYPALHPSITASISPHIPNLHFHDPSTPAKPNKTYSTFVVGHFTCYNPQCKRKYHGWTSGQITLVIKSYSSSEYDAEVFGQRCKACNRLGKMVMDKETYVERVARRLLVWAGVQVDRVEVGGRDTAPHEREFCEGCKRGVCGRFSG